MSNPDLGVVSAYEVQKSYVKRRLLNDQIKGFKAGLTNERSQNRFGVKMPVSGVLFASGKREVEVGINHKQGEQLMIEAEIGLVVENGIDQPITKISRLKKRIRAVVAAIEIPDLGFENMTELKGVDIIASNALPIPTFWVRLKTLKSMIRESNVHHVERWRGYKRG